MEVSVRKRMSVQRVRGESNFWIAIVVSLAGRREEAPRKSV